MADDDEIDILGDFSFDSCLSNNAQGIPSYSDALKGDAVHPQWLLDSSTNCWYDTIKRNGPNISFEPTKSCDGSASDDESHSSQSNSIVEWSDSERKLLNHAMNKHGRDFRKLASIIKTKSESDIETLISVEYGINLESADNILYINESDDTPQLAYEEVITETNNVSFKINDAHENIKTQPNTKKKSHRQIIEKKKKRKFINGVKTGNSRPVKDVSLPRQRKPSRSKAKFNIGVKIDQRFVKKISKVDINVINADVKPKMQIVTGSGQALPLSEGEQVIKIEKRNSSESESDIEIDVDSDTNKCDHKSVVLDQKHSVIRRDANVTSQRKFEPFRKRHRKMNMMGDGGCTIMHTEAGDLYEIASEPKRDKCNKKSTPIKLVYCKRYGIDKPCPYEVHMNVSTLISMDVHAHCSECEVMGLLGGEFLMSEGGVNVVKVMLYEPAAANASTTHCDMCPVAQVEAAERLRSHKMSLVGWHHSHPSFPAQPSHQDLLTQYSMQSVIPTTFVSIITSQQWITGRTATHYRCLLAECEGSDESSMVGYQLRTKLTPDINSDNIEQFLERLRGQISRAVATDTHHNVVENVCRNAGLTYIDKCLSSISHHLKVCGYSDNDKLYKEIVQGVTDVFR